MTLNELKIGETAAITAVGGDGALRCRLLDMGLTPRTLVTLRKVAPMGDPIEIHIRVQHRYVGEEDQGLDIACEVTLSYGGHIPSLIEGAREKARRAVEFMTGMVVHEINIVVIVVGSRSGERKSCHDDGCKKFSHVLKNIVVCLGYFLFLTISFYLSKNLSSRLYRLPKQEPVN